MHRLIQRQLKKYFSNEYNELVGKSNDESNDNLIISPLEWEKFINAVDDAYSQFDNDHRMIERSLELSSVELSEANSQLRELLTTVEGKVVERTAEVTQSNKKLEQALTDLQEMQVQLIQSEKMSALGQLIAGIAHEINNPVNFIHGNLSYLSSYTINLLAFVELSQKCCSGMNVAINKMAEEIDLEFMKNDLPKIIQSMEVGTSRIREIVLSLRNFSHLGEAEFKQVDIHQGIDDTLLILKHRLSSQGSSSQIDVIKDYGDIPLVNCFAGQLNQVFLNILVNAIDALEDTQSINHHQKSPTTHSWIRIQTTVIDNQYIEIVIADNGMGISESIQQEIFNPFFTTKPVGKGTGMGMAISYQIITERHNGRLTFASTLGKGTEFKIQMPIA
jgi:two-component system, NtrC family, sensor kinase